MKLDEWARRWVISSEAIYDLKQIFGLNSLTSSLLNSGAESAVLNSVRLEATQKGARLWRNNVGAVHTATGSFIRFGLANESTAVNQTVKSADLIGIKPVKITHSMIGYTIGQFVSREIKAAGWRYRGTEREIAQLRWAELIVALGGDACFATGEGTL